MKTIFIFIFFMFFLSFTSASLSINQGKMNFDLNEGEENCQTVKLMSEEYAGLITLRDVWAEDFKEGGNLHPYTLNASDHKLEIIYPNQIEEFSIEEEIEVCLTAHNSGEFKGALMFTPKSETNVVVEVGTWLLVNVQEPQTTPSNNDGTSSGSSSGGGSVTTKTPQKDETQELEIEQLSTEPGITGHAVKESGNQMNPLLVVIILIVIAAIILYLYKRRKKE